MNKAHYNELCDEAAQMAEHFSNKERVHYSGERFIVDRVTPYTGTTAIIVFRKHNDESGALTRYAAQLAFRNNNRWWCFFIDHEALPGFAAFGKDLLTIERLNSEIL